MKFLVPTNFQDNLIPQLIKLNNKKELLSLYGKLTTDFIGGGRPAYILPSLNKKQLEEHVEETHRNELEFNYLLNAPCLGNKEYTALGQRKIHQLFCWLAKINIDSVTVAVPYLAQLIKKYYPQFKIHISATANVDSIIKAKYWENLGADVITLQSTTLNRDFKALKQIKKYVKCKLALIINDTCLYRCPISYYHYAVTSHASQVDAYPRESGIDYCAINCKELRLSDPVNIIRSVWIRPEDTRFYEEIGIDYLKISGRHMDTNFILNAVNAYTTRHYDGNLADIFPMYHKRLNLRSVKKDMPYIRYLFRHFIFNAFKTDKIFTDEPLKIYLDNKALAGFLEFFIQGNCRQGLCEECGYCKKIAEKAVKIDKEYQKRMLSEYKEAQDGIISR